MNFTKFTADITGEKYHFFFLHGFHFNSSSEFSFNKWLINSVRKSKLDASTQKYEYGDQYM